MNRREHQTTARMPGRKLGVSKGQAILKRTKSRESYKFEAALLRVRLEERERTIQSQNHLIQHLSSLLQSLGMNPERDMVASPTPHNSETPERTETTSVSEDPLQPSSWAESAGDTQDETGEMEDGFDSDLQWDEPAEEKGTFSSSALNKEQECGMCLLKIEANEVLYKLRCGHQFHLLCVGQSVGSRSIENRCAACRQEFTIEECKDINKLMQQMKREERENLAALKEELRYGKWSL